MKSACGSADSHMGHSVNLGFMFRKSFRALRGGRSQARGILLFFSWVPPVSKLFFRLCLIKLRHLEMLYLLALVFSLFFFL